MASKMDFMKILPPFKIIPIYQKELENFSKGFLFYFALFLLLAVAKIESYFFLFFLQLSTFNLEKFTHTQKIWTTK